MKLSIVLDLKEDKIFKLIVIPKKTISFNKLSIDDNN